ncbi:MAG: phosphatase PAP2 family protein [Siphonobacter sp.]
MKSIFITFYIWFILGLISIASAQEPDTLQCPFVNNDSVRLYEPVKLNRAYVKSYWYDTKTVVSRPFHWSKKNWTKAGVITGVSALSYLFADQRVQSYAQEHRTSFTNTASRIVDPLGNGRYLWITSGVVFLHGQIFNNSKTTRVGLLILESQLINGVLGQAVKLAAGRKRPWDGATSHEWAGPQYPPFHSFPSGHAQTAFALATVIAEEFKETKAVPIVSYSLASLTCLSRINANAHWLSDLIMGAALGHFISKTIVRQHLERPKGKNTAKLSMTLSGATLTF